MENIKTPVQVLAEIEEKLNAKIAEANEEIKAGTLSVKVMNELGEIEKEYASQKAIVVFAELMTEEFSKIAAIKRLTFPVIGHQVETVTDKTTKITKTTGIKTIERERQIDLLRFCKFAKLDTDWQFNVSALNQSFCLWAAAELNYSKFELKELARTYYLQKEVQKLAKGEKPASNNALCKLLQTVIDSILPPDVEGASVYKCNNHDVNYIKMCYTRKGKKALTVKVANDSYLRNLIMDVMHRIIEGKRYNVDYKMIKEETSGDNQKSAPKADTPASPKDDAKLEINPESELDLDFDTSIFEEDLGELDDSWLNEELPELSSLTA